MFPLSPNLPLTQLGGMSGDQIIDSLTNDYVKWGGIGLLLLVALFFARFILRSVVNRQVHGIQESSMGFMDLDSMFKKGLVSREEYQEMRQRMARRELDRLKEVDTSRQSLNVLSTISKNPALARVLVEKELLAKEPSADAAAPAQPAPQMERPAVVPIPQPAKAPPAKSFVADPEIMRKMIEKEWITPGDPLSDPRMARKAEPKLMAPPPAARGKKKPMDIEDLLARGLISREEYERLAAMFDQED